MWQSKVTKSLFLALLLSLIACVSAEAAYAQAPKFSSLYTNLKRDCRPAIKLKKGEELEGDMPLTCKGYGGYQINVGYSATSAQFSISLGNSDNIVVSTMQPIDYDLKRTVEWRFAKGKPFAVIYRTDLTKGDPSDAAGMWSKENKTGESLVIKGLKGFEHIDFEINAREPDANAKARALADGAYVKK